MKISAKNLTAVLVINAYLLNAILAPHRWHFIDSINLIFHEAGHILFKIFGVFWIEIAGGSITQVLIPLSIAVYFFLTHQRLGSALSLSWCGQSIYNVSVYTGDALHQKLPLIADGLTHDWNHLLWHFGLLRHTDTIATVIATLGVLTLIAGFSFGVYLSLQRHADFQK